MASQIQHLLLTGRKDCHRFMIPLTGQFDCAGTIAEGFRGDAHAIEHAHEKVGDWSIHIARDMPCATTTSGVPCQYQRQIVVRVRVAVA